MFQTNLLNRPKNSGQGFVKNYENRIPFWPRKPIENSVFFQDHDPFVFKKRHKKYPLYARLM